MLIKDQIWCKIDLDVNGPAVSGDSDRCGGGEKSKLPRFWTLLLVANLHLSATEETGFRTLQKNVVCVFLAPRRCFLSSRGFLLDGCSLLSLTEEDGVRNIRDGCRIAMKRKVTLVPQPESTCIKSIKGWRKSYIGASDSQPEPSCLSLCKEPWHQTGVCNIQLTNL